MASDKVYWDKSFHTDQSVYVGLDDDLEGFIYSVFDSFEKTSGPRYKTFIEIWKETSFGLIFSGRESFRELYEFTEEMFDRIKKYALSVHNKKPNNKLVRFAAIYLMYSLYFKQPCRPKVKFRIIQEELIDLLATVETAKMEKHWDVSYAWCKLFTSHAFYFTAKPLQMGLEVAVQLEHKDVQEKSRGSDREIYFKSKEYLRMVRKLSKRHKRYLARKNAVANPKDPSDSSLYLTDSNFPDTLKSLAVEAAETKKERKSVKPVESVIGSTRRQLKDKFFTGVGEDEAEEARRKKINKNKKKLDYFIDD